MILEDVVNYLTWISSEGRSFGGLLDIEDIEDCLCWTSLVVLLIILCKVGKFLWITSYFYHHWSQKIRNVNRLLPIELSKDKIWSLPELTPLFFALFLHYCSHPQNSPFFSAAFYSATILIFWKIFFYHQYLRIIPQIHMITENSFVSCKCHHETFVTTHHTRQKVRWW